MRLDEAEQVDMVLGDGARDRGATADLISTNPATGAGVAFVSAWLMTPTQSGSAPGGSSTPTSTTWPPPTSGPPSTRRKKVSPHDHHLGHRRPLPRLRHHLAETPGQIDGEVTQECRACGWSVTWAMDEAAHSPSVTP